MNKSISIFIILFVLALLLFTGIWYTSNTNTEYSNLIPNRELESIEQSLDMQYYGFACYCPQWITLENTRIYDSLSNLEDNDLTIPDSIFWEIEPQEPGIESPFEVGEQNQCSDYGSRIVFRFRGRFYKYPQKIKYEDETRIVKVFQYSSVECK